MPRKLYLNQNFRKKNKEFKFIIVLNYNEIKTNNTKANEDNLDILAAL